MSKCSVFRILKSKCSHCTLLRPKYCALSDVEAKRRKRKATASLRIESTSPFENSDSAWQPGCKTSAPAGAQCYSSRRGELLQRGERARFIAELSQLSAEFRRPAAAASASTDHNHHGSQWSIRSKNGSPKRAATNPSTTATVATPIQEIHEAPRAIGIPAVSTTTNVHPKPTTPVPGSGNGLSLWGT